MLTNYVLKKNLSRPTRLRASSRRRTFNFDYANFEARTLLAGISFDANTGLVSVEGSGGNDTVFVNYDNADAIKVTIANVEQQRFSIADVQLVRFRGLDGDDIFKNNTDVNSQAYGHAGDDYLRGGGGNDWYQGGPGNDTLIGGRRNDALRGGDGNDELLGGVQHDRLFGGDGNDVIHGEFGDDFLRGDQGDDSLYGDDGADRLLGSDGNDMLVGGAGRDVFFGGLGSDMILGGSGNDYAKGGDGNDIIHGGNDHDILHGQEGVDLIYGENGWDQLFGGEGNDRIFGGSGNDTVYGQDGNDEIDLGDGNDTGYGDRGNDMIAGGNGNDEIFGRDGNDTVDAGAGNDFVNGDNGHDTLMGGSGTDELFGSSGNDRLEGGSENDRLLGGDGEDFLIGDSGADELLGGRGSDSLFGGIGAGDILDGESGPDRFLKWTGDQTVGVSSDDAIVVFKNGDSAWTSREIEAVRQGFTMIVERTGSTRLLRDSLSTDPINIIKTNSLSGGIAQNEYTGRQISQTEWEFTRNIYFAEWDEGNSQQNEIRAIALIHEISHNWDEAWEINWTLPGSGFIANAFRSISGWTHTNPNSNTYESGPLSYCQYAELSGDQVRWWHLKSAEFYRDYGKRDPCEDWATIWEAAFNDDLSNADQSRLSAKLSRVNQFLDLV